MSIQEIVSPVLNFFKTPADEQPLFTDLPEYGAVIATPDLRGTYTGFSLDSFGEAWFTVVSAFEQRHYPEGQFVWQYVAVQS